MTSARRPREEIVEQESASLGHLCSHREAPCYLLLPLLMPLKLLALVAALGLTLEASAVEVFVLRQGNDRQVTCSRYEDASLQAGAEIGLGGSYGWVGEYLGLLVYRPTAENPRSETSWNLVLLDRKSLTTVRTIPIGQRVPTFFGPPARMILGSADGERAWFITYTSPGVPQEQLTTVHLPSGAVSTVLMEIGRASLLAAGGGILLNSRDGKIRRFELDLRQSRMVPGDLDRLPPAARGGGWFHCYSLSGGKGEELWRDTDQTLTCSYLRRSGDGWALFDSEVRYAAQSGRQPRLITARAGLPILFYEWDEATSKVHGPYFLSAQSTALPFGRPPEFSDFGCSMDGRILGLLTKSGTIVLRDRVSGQDLHEIREPEQGVFGASNTSILLR